MSFREGVYMKGLKSAVLYGVFVSLFLLLIGCTKDAGSPDDKESETSINEDNHISESQGQEEQIEEEAKIGEKETQTSTADGYIPPTGFNESGVWYEIFVRGFADSDGDGIGDFNGITSKLDYLNDGKEGQGNDLEIDGIWLMPINPSPSYHGYDVTNYYEVNPEYGTMEDFENLLEQAHGRGIKVIMDLVLNHSSYSHPYFQEALKDESSPYREYYRFEDGDDDLFNFDINVWNHRVWHSVGDQKYYAIFWDQMPDLNYDNQAVRDEMIDVASFWLEKGVDGFRIDAVSHVFGAGELAKGETYADKIDEWWIEFNEALRMVKEDYYLVGEAWEPLDARMGYSKYFDTTFDFDLAESGILTMVKNEVDLDVVNNGFVNKVENIYDVIEEEGYPFIDAPFLSNHDQRRAMDYLNGDVTDMKLAANIYMTLPGNPFIYYGEEIGMTGNKPDENIREPFIWGDSYQTSWKSLDYNDETVSVLKQDRIPDSLLNHYRDLIRIRKANDGLLNGVFIGLETKSNRVLAYVRISGAQEVLVIHNLSERNQNLSLSELSDYGLSGEEVLLYEFPYAFEHDSQEIVLPGKSTYIIQLN